MFIFTLSTSLYTHLKLDSSILWKVSILTLYSNGYFRKKRKIIIGKRKTLLLLTYKTFSTTISDTAWQSHLLFSNKKHYG